MITKADVQEAAVKAYCGHVKSGVLKHSAEVQLAYLIGFGNGGAFSATAINKDVTDRVTSVKATAGFLSRFMRAKT